MPIEIHHSITVAQEVLKRVNAYEGVKIFADGTTEGEFNDFDLSLYSNLREQGYCLRTSTSKGLHYISFASNRSSDHIVVYRGMNFNEIGCIPSEQAYKNKKLFNVGEYDAAAEHIVKLMRKLIEKKRSYHNV